MWTAYRAEVVKIFAAMTRCTRARESNSNVKERQAEKKFVTTRNCAHGKTVYGNGTHDGQIGTYNASKTVDSNFLEWRETESRIW